MTEFVAGAMSLCFRSILGFSKIVYPPSDASMSLTDFDPREVQRVCRECAHVLAPMQEGLQVRRGT